MLLVDSSSCCSFAFHLHLMSVFSHSRHSLKGRKPSLFATQPVKTSSNFTVPSFLLWFARGSQVNTGAKVGFEVKPISTLQIFCLTDFFFFLFSLPPWFFFPGKFGGDPGDSEHHWDQPPSAHSPGGLPQPAHGEQGRRRRRRRLSTLVL